MMENINIKIQELQGRLNNLIKKHPPITAKQTLKNNTEKDFDPDSSPKAWEFYLKYYKKLFQKQKELNTYLNPLFKDNKKEIAFWTDSGYYIRICGTFKYTVSNNGIDLELTTSPLDVGKNIGFAGDCCFNFNEKKVGLFAGLLCAEENIELRNSIMNLIFQFNKMHYSPINFAMMPKNGSINNFKGTDDFDRLSFLLYSINEFYKNNSIQIFTSGKGRPVDALNDFLNKLKIYDIKYHNLFYPELEKDNKLYNDLLSNGKKEIENTEDIIEYLELAIRFWEAKANYYKEQTKQQHKTTK